MPADPRLARQMHDGAIRSGSGRLHGPSLFVLCIPLDAQTRMRKFVQKRSLLFSFLFGQDFSVQERHRHQSLTVRWAVVTADTTDWLIISPFFHAGRTAISAIRSGVPKERISCANT
jgi:hypothetical protein